MMRRRRSQYPHHSSAENNHHHGGARRSDRYRMRPSIARMTLDLGYDDMGMDDNTQKNHAKNTEALQHRLAELLVFEIRQDGETQFRSLSVRGLYKYVLRAMKMSAEKRRAIDPLAMSASTRTRVTNRLPPPPPSPTKKKTKKKRSNNNNAKSRKKDNKIYNATSTTSVQEEDDSSSCSSSSSFNSDCDIDEKINNLHETLTGQRRSNAFSEGEKSVSFGPSTKIPALPIAVEQEELNGSMSSFGGGLGGGGMDSSHGSHSSFVARRGRGSLQYSPNNNKVHGSGSGVTNRERLGGFLHPRDMRRLVTPFSASNEPELIVRRHVMLLNFDPLRAVILRDRLLVLVPDGADSLLVDLEKRVRGGTREIERSVFGETTTVSGSNTTSIGTPNLKNNNSNSNNSAQVSEISKAILESSTNIGDSQHSKGSNNTNTKSLGGDSSVPTNNNHTKRLSPATNILEKMKSTIATAASSGIAGIGGGGSNRDAMSSFGTDKTDREDDDDNNNDDDDEIAPFDDQASEFQEWEEMESRGWVDLPFELQCLDAVLGSVSAILGRDSNELQTNSINAMDRLLLGGGGGSGGGGEEILRHMKNSIKEMTQRVQGFIRAMNLVLDETEDMALMNLSRLLTHPERFIQPVSEDILNEESDEPELILEAHLQQAFSLTNSLDLVRGEIETTQELINQRLDAVRNRLLLANMIISVGSFCVAIGSFIGSIFGMNVTNFIEDDPNAFRLIVIGTCVGMFAMLILVGAVLWYAGTLPNLRSF